MSRHPFPFNGMLTIWNTYYVHLAFHNCDLIFVVITSIVIVSVKVHSDYQITRTGSVIIDDI